MKEMLIYINIILLLFIWIPVGHYWVFIQKEDKEHKRGFILKFGFNLAVVITIISSILLIIYS